MNLDITFKILFSISLLMLLWVIICIIKKGKLSLKEVQNLCIVALLICFSIAVNYYDNKNVTKPFINNIASSINEEEKILKTIYIGDSRTVGMYLSVYKESYKSDIFLSNENEIWQASVGKGYSWFKSDIITNLNTLLNENNYKVIIQMGANDLSNLSAPSLYMKSVYDLSIKYPDSIFIVTNVGPIDDTVSNYDVTNEDVIKYNENLFNNFYLYHNENFYFFDLYNNIIEKYTSFDGVHYDQDTYLYVYKILKNC